ncbi:MAG TPA: hypothetical protein VF607_07180 [Verrucomicrobiae bacterium]
MGEGTNFTVSIGGATVQIPVPESFVEVGTKNRMIPMVPGNRLLAWFAMPEDMKHFDSEPAHQLRRHIQVQVPKKSEDQELDADHFAMVATGIAKQQDQGHAKAAQEVNKILKQLSAPEKGGPPIRISEPKSLGSFLKTDEAVGFAMLMSVTANEQGLRSAHPIAVGAVAMRVKQKLLYVYAYSMAGSTASIDWVKSEAKAVAEAILKAN